MYTRQVRFSDYLRLPNVHGKHTFDRLGRPKTVVDVVGTRTFAYNGPSDDGTLQLDTETIDGSGGTLREIGEQWNR
jgi:hypothetical protein